MFHDVMQKYVFQKQMQRSVALCSQVRFDRPMGPKNWTREFSQILFNKYLSLSRVIPPSMAKKITPLMKQYQGIKTKYPDALLLFRVGDFYETFGADAVRAAKF